MKIVLRFVLFLAFGTLTACSQLAVTVSPLKITGNKAVVQLKMKNNLDDAVKSARAVCFLLDDRGKMIGQSTKWVVGQNKTGLAPGATNSFNFVITSSKPFASTNLTAKLSFTLVVLDGGKLANVQQSVAVTPEIK
jgi:hypothetical protein